MTRAVDLVAGWCRARQIEGMTVEVAELPGRTPLIVIEVPAFGPGRDDDPVLLYGHLDKQPEMHGWRDGLGPWTPVLEGDRLYGRGGADDGYAAFASLAAIEAVQRAGGAHARCLVLVEASEESGSLDLPAHLEALSERIGTPSLVVCLDSGCNDYDRLWVTTSLRGLAGGTLTVDIVEEGVHSGAAPAGWCRARSASPANCWSGSRTRARARSGSARAPRRHPRRSPPPGRGDGGHDTGLRRALPVRAGSRAGDGRPGRADPGAHLAADVVRRGRGRPAGHLTGRQRAAALDLTAALVPAARRPATPTAALAAVSAALTADPPYGARVTLRRPGSRAGLERADVRAVAGRVAGARARRPPSGRRRGPSARVGRSRSWACSVSASPRRSSSSPACSDRTATRTARTSTSTCPRASG